RKSTSTLFPYTTLFRSRRDKRPGITPSKSNPAPIVSSSCLSGQALNVPVAILRHWPPGQPRSSGWRDPMSRIVTSASQDEAHARSEEHTSELQSLAYLV